MDSLRLAPRRDNPFVAQAGEMLGKRGLAERYGFLNLADRRLAFVQTAKNHKPVCISKAFEEFSGLIGFEAETFGFYIHKV